MSAAAPAARTARRRGQAARRRTGLAAILLCSVFATGCESADESVRAAARHGASEPQQLSLAGIEALRAGNPKLASRAFNAALKLDIRNSYLQFLNGLAYHQQALNSDRSLFPLAAQGYRLAIQFDTNNWLARYHMGLLHLDQRRYEDAKAAFADAALYKDDEPDIFYNLAVSAYYSRDPETAAGALKRLREIEPDSARAQRASALAAAALGRPGEAQLFLARYRQIVPDASLTAHVAHRLRDWKRFHDHVRKAGFRPPPAAPRGNRAVRPAQSLDPGLGGFPAQDAPPGGSATQGAARSDAAPPPLDPAGRMVIVDVVIISSQEDISTAKGVNLLNGLSIQFGGPMNPAFSRIFRTDSGELAPTRGGQSTITRAITVPAITYSLNIANAGTTRNEILARPTLVGLSGQPSEFFSGENIKAAAVSKTATEGATQVERDIGVKLAVTPEFLEDGRVKLNVVAERTFLQTPSASVQFDFQLRTSKTTVNANVVMNNGETLILSGLSEKETESIRDGVPGLQDIPVVQYLFSRQTTRDFNKSVLVLLTPRLPEYTYRPSEIREREEARQGAAGRTLNELKARYADWFRPYPNWASVFHHLQANSLYREFRTGDVTLERWDTQSSHAARLKTAQGFLYY